jgi:hypothetical protein
MQRFHWRFDAIAPTRLIEFGRNVHWRLKQLFLSRTPRSAVVHQFEARLLEKICYEINLA